MGSTRNASASDLGREHARAGGSLGLLLAAATAVVVMPTALVVVALAATLAGLGLVGAARCLRGRAARVLRRSRDPLTGLDGAAAFRRFVQTEFAGRDAGFGILFLELRQGSLLRSTFGREAVEAMCRTLATRLHRAVRGGDGLAHFGDGLFAVALDGVRDRATFNRAAERLREEVAQPVLVAGTRVRPRWDAAGVLAPEDGRCGDELLAAAEAAREMARTEPGQPLRALPQASRTAAEDRSRCQRELLEAVETGAFFPLFQPQLDLVTGRVDRAEALMRWQRSDGKVASPGVFLDQLRELDALPRVSDEVYRMALAEAAVWRASGIAFSRLALNLDAAQVAPLDWADHLLALVRGSPLPPSAVEVEVSENMLQHAQLDRLVAGLQTLRRAGVRVSLDDFGTGYASLAQIARLPIDLVKLDGRLLWDASKGRRPQIVVEGLVELLRKLDLPCVLEGIETPAHLELARRLGARWGQGYLIGRPMPAPELEAWFDVSPPADAAGGLDRGAQARWRAARASSVSTSQPPVITTPSMT